MEDWLVVVAEVVVLLLVEAVVPDLVVVDVDDWETVVLDLEQVVPEKETETAALTNCHWTASSYSILHVITPLVPFSTVLLYLSL